MAVLPELDSRRVFPGPSSPRASRSSTSAAAMRSFTEPVGLAPSSFAKSFTLGSGESESIRTSGVLPTVARRLSTTAPCSVTVPSVVTIPCVMRATSCATAGDRRQEPDLVVGIDASIQAVQVPDVFAVQVDVDESMQSAFGRAQPIPERGVAVDERIDDVADGVALDVEG